MRTRTRGTPKPTDGTADLPFQSKGRDSRPSENWTLLRVKIWRLIQRAAARLRHSVRNWRLLVRYRTQLRQLYSDKEWPQVESLASSTVYGHLQLRTRFVRGSHPDEAVVIRGGITGDRVSGPRSTLVRRGMFAARTTVHNFAMGLRSTVLGIVGQQCLLCGSLYHNALGCLEDFERTFFREAEHLDSVITRMRDVSIREADWSDDFIRIGMARLAMRKAQDARLLGLVFWFGALARHSARAGGGGVVLALLRYPVLANELWRIMTGSVVLPEPPRTRLLLHRIWGSEGLYDFAVQELRRRGLDVQYPGPETEGGATTQVVPANSTATSGGQNVIEDTVDEVAASVLLGVAYETQLMITDLVYLMVERSPYMQPLLRQHYDLPLVSGIDYNSTVCHQCSRRAWYGSTCPGCRALKTSVISLDVRLWRAVGEYSAHWIDAWKDAELWKMRQKLVELLTKFEDVSDMLRTVLSTAEQT